MNLAEKAIEEIERRGWHQGAYEGGDGSLCLLGALRVAAGRDSDHVLEEGDDDIFAAQHAVRVVTGHRHPHFWNDTPGRTEAEVLEALRLAGKELSK